LPPEEWPSDVSAAEETGVALTPERVLHLLTYGEIEVEGLIPWSSNATLLVTVRDGELTTLAVYKPQGGERPLWDFRYGTLGLREVATHLVCEALGWGLIPPTVLRQGPHGLGSVQFFVRAREDAHFFTIQDAPAYQEDLQRLAAFDAITNNADRKSGHCLVDFQGRLWAIDNALTFHAEPKLRTVIWLFAGQPLPDGILADLQALRDVLAEDSRLDEALKSLLDEKEVSAFQRRLEQLIEDGRFPKPGEGRVLPWPLV
jgi:uncharacterized repeat protein (TIGR03843 family)